MRGVTLAINFCRWAAAESGAGAGADPLGASGPAPPGQRKRRGKIQKHMTFIKLTRQKHHL